LSQESFKTPKGRAQSSHGTALSQESFKTPEGRTQSSHGTALSQESFKTNREETLSYKSALSDPLSYKSTLSNPLSFKSVNSAEPLSFKSTISEIPFKKQKKHQLPKTCYKCNKPLSTEFHLKTTFQNKDKVWKEIGFCSYECFDKEKNAFE
jgi:hypothetical protein